MLTFILHTFFYIPRLLVPVFFSSTYISLFFPVMKFRPMENDCRGIWFVFSFRPPHVPRKPNPTWVFLNSSDYFHVCPAPIAAFTLDIAQNRGDLDRLIADIREMKRRWKPALEVWTRTQAMMTQGDSGHPRTSQASHGVSDIVGAQGATAQSLLAPESPPVREQAPVPKSVAVKFAVVPCGTREWRGGGAEGGGVTLLLAIT